jgi:hypothetical protein
LAPITLLFGDHLVTPARAPCRGLFSEQPSRGGTPSAAQCWLVRPSRPTSSPARTWIRPIGLEVAKLVAARRLRQGDLTGGLRATLIALIAICPARWIARAWMRSCHVSRETFRTLQH